MCLNPIRIKNPKLELSLAGGTPYYIEVPCGECAECKKLKRDEWYFRSYYEAQSTFDSNGFVYFDTLTYRDEELPHVSEFIEIDKQYDTSCFDVEDYRNFIAQLREEWHRLYKKGYINGDSVENLKYFLTSEYGTSENGTHRPHYHVLFFVRNNAIDPLILSKLVNKCWHRGRTDGIDYHPYHYVMKHVYSHRFNNDLLHMQQVCLYVSKYITKDSNFQKIIDQRLYNIFKDKYLRLGYIIPEDEEVTIDDMLFILGEEEQERYKKLKKNMNQFHRQSKGFGEDWLNYNDYDEVFKTGMISMPDKNNIVKHIPIPSYYQMKIWYDLVKDNGKAVRWELNDEGKKYKFSHVLQTVERMADKVEDWRKNMLMYDYFHDKEDKDWYDKIINRFDDINKSRDLRMFTMYLLFYKGRLKDPAWYKRTLDCLYDKNNVNYATDPIEFYMIDKDSLLQYNKSIEAFNNEGRSVLYGYNHGTYKKKFGCRFVSKKNLGNTIDWEEDGYSGPVLLWMQYALNFKNINGFTPSLLRIAADSFDAIDSDGIEMYLRTVHDTDDPNFEGYDEMWKLYCESQRDKNEFKQKGFDEKEDVKFRLSRYYNVKTI